MLWHFSIFKGLSFFQKKDFLSLPKVATRFVLCKECHKNIASVVSPWSVTLFHVYFDARGSHAKFMSHFALPPKKLYMSDRLKNTFFTQYWKRNSVFKLAPTLIKYMVLVSLLILLFMLLPIRIVESLKKTEGRLNCKKYANFFCLKYLTLQITIIWL